MKKIKFEAEIDPTVSPAEIKIKAIVGPWEDFGYLLEIMAFMSRIVMDHQEMTKDQVLDYIRNYLDRAVPSYKTKKQL